MEACLRSGKRRARTDDLGASLSGDGWCHNRPMQLPVDYPYGLAPRPRWAAPRWVCLVLAVCWALAGAALGVAVFGSWMQPAPQVDPALDWPLPANSSLSVWLGVYVMAYVLGCLSAGAAVAGASYLRRA